MSRMRSRYYIDATVEAGKVERKDALVSTTIDLDQLLWYGGNDRRFHSSTLEVFEISNQGTIVRQVPSQEEEGKVTWIMPGLTPEAGKRYFRIGFDSVDVARVGKANLQDRVVIFDLGKELLVSKNTQEICRYRYRDPWKPHFYPIYGPNGNVTSDRCSEEGRLGHSHHHGLWLSYGSMDVPQGANIVTEEEEIIPRRGPAGRMVHDIFERIDYGWVYGLFSERLTYQKPDGTPFAREHRTIRIFAPDVDTRIIDWTVKIERPEDSGPRGIGFHCRVAPTMRIRDLSLPSPDDLLGAPRDKPGKIENAAGKVGERPCRGMRVPWTDFSGPVGKASNGIALFDHPSNPDFPERFGVREYGLLSIGRHYPCNEPTVTLRYRAFVHRGDAAEGDIALAWDDYAHPCRVILGPEIKATNK
jgi:hypothetical protein